MTSKQRENLENIKSVISMMYETDGVADLVAEKSNKALIRVKRKESNIKSHDVFFWYNTDTGDMKEVYIKDIGKLLISDNLVVLEESKDAEKCSIKILDKETLDTIEETILDLSDGVKGLTYTESFYKANYGIGYNGVVVPVDNGGVKNIHGQNINLDMSFEKLNDHTFISCINSNIKVFDNKEDMRLVKEIPLKIFNGKVRYYPILNTKDVRENSQQVIFMYIADSDKVYAISLADKKIHIVNDTRYKIKATDFIEKLGQCLVTSDHDRKELFNYEYKKFKGNLDKQRRYEQRQFEIDCNSLLNLRSNKFDFYYIIRNGERYITLRSLLDCIKEYQRDFNGETNTHYMYEQYGDCGEIPSVMKFCNTMDVMDTEIAMSLTPYKIKSVKLIDEIRTLQDKENLGKLIVTDQTITFDELVEIEGLQRE